MDNQRLSTRRQQQQHCLDHSPVGVDLQRSYLLASVASQDNTEQWPRRGSLPNPTPIFKTKHFGHIQVSLSRPPSTEILTPCTHSRLQDTPVQIRKFMNSIRPEDSSEDDLSSDESRPRNRRRHGGQKKVIKAPSNTNLVGNNGKNNNANEEEAKPKPKPKKVVKLTEAERKALKTSTQFGELQMVNLWNKWKFSFPTGLANRIQLKQVFKEIIPKCTKPEYVVENIFKVFDPMDNGTISLRELLMAISMSMKGEPKQKLHWAYKLYDKDGDGAVELEEMEDVFGRLCQISQNIEAAEKAAKMRARGIKPIETKKPVPKPEPKKSSSEVKDPEKPEEETENKKKSKFKVKVVKQNVAEEFIGVVLANLEEDRDTFVKVYKGVTTMSSKMKTTQDRLARGPKSGTESIAQKQARIKAEKEAAALAAKEEAEKRKAEEEARKALEEFEAEEAANKEDEIDAKQSAQIIFMALDKDGDGVLTEEEFVEGCLSDPMFLSMLETFSCEFLWA